MGRLFKGRSTPQAPQLPPQPPAPELMDFLDEISGVQTITTTGPDGKKRRVTQRLPMTPQEQQILDQAERLINQSVTNIERLYQHDPASVVNYQPFIQAFTSINNERMQDLAQIGNFKDIAEKVEQFRTINKNLAMREFESKRRASEEIFARRGISKGTEASEYRAAMAREQELLGQQLDVNAENYGEDLAARRLGREKELYNTRETGRQGRLQEAEVAYNLERQKEQDIKDIRQNSINENLGLMELGQNIQGKGQKSELGLQGNNAALGVFNAQAANQNQRDANNIARITNQYGLDMQQHNATPARFGQKILDLGLATAGQVAGSYIGSKIPGTGNGAAVNNPTPVAPVQFGRNYKRNQAFTQLARVGR